MMSERPKETTREEDYRDYEERDLRDGWPYADVDGGRRKSNEAYGAAPASPEVDTNAGREIADDPAIVSRGGPSASSEVAVEAIEDDALEEQIFDQFTAHGDVDEDAITVTVQHGVAKLSGDVGTRDDAALAARVASSVPGVRGVYNLLVPVAVDSHIPGDATD
jgi:osmotically-inducible protein OsmY